MSSINNLTINTIIDTLTNERDVLRLTALSSADPKTLIEEFKTDRDLEEISNDLAYKIVQNVPKTSRYNRLYPAVVALPDDLSTLESDIVLPGKVGNGLHRDGSLTISPKAFADDVLACLQQIRPRVDGKYPSSIDRVTLAIFSMDLRAMAKHGYSSDVNEYNVPRSLLASLCDRFVETISESAKPSVQFAHVAQPDKGVGRMFLPVGDILRGDRVVATVEENGEMTLTTTNRADALAVVGGILVRRRDEHIDVALEWIAREIELLEQQ